MTHTGFYAGSFDPVTNGHLDVVRSACRMLDKLVIGVGIHPGKVPVLAAEKRMELLRDVCEPVAKEHCTILEIHSFSDLTVKAAARFGAQLLIRGLRDGSDCDYEMQLAGMNGRLAPDIGTVFLPASPDVRHITATLVRQIAGMGGDISAFVPKAVIGPVTEAFTNR
ncbi:phosphopantetheine adenylyltransferase [Agaricicola taiwanensis]|uniref:Phosphopantetheine adenylyltransferase n=1 Tax=Agaricicola taiwanensis TaxID=591372 RepID=A0A8J2YI97_9RHOB|nr:pantetheine-phosphate adenylyltransferase [Agaricicola taiwanensis]GGE44878.1 phosphopantetheine adenylyltransferase [Agaricicola taiwanensis]